MAANEMTLHNSLAELVPHRPPMLLIDRIVRSDITQTVGEVQIDDQVPFFMQGLGVPSWVGLEYAGQVSAAYFSLQAFAALADKQQPVATPGMLISCKTLTSRVDYFAPGSVLQVHAAPLSALTGQMVRFKGLIYLLARDQPLTDGAIVGEPLVNMEFSVYMGGAQVDR